MVLIPGEAADETTMGEWLEDRQVKYVSLINGRRDTPVFEFHLSLGTSPTHLPEPLSAE
jgi:hypothetical protein